MIGFIYLFAVLSFYYFLAYSTLSRRIEALMAYMPWFDLINMESDGVMSQSLNYYLIKYLNLNNLKFE